MAMRSFLVAAGMLAVSCYQQPEPVYYPRVQPTYAAQPPRAQPPPSQQHPENCARGTDGQLRCTEGHMGYPMGYPPGYVGDGYPSGYPQGETCLTGSDGINACGHDCKIGSAGIAGCSNIPGGTCSTGSDGLVYCQTQR